MSVVLITGAAGLIGSEAVKHFSEEGFDVVGIDNNMRAVFFGQEASTAWMTSTLKQAHSNYTHYAADIRDQGELDRIFRQYGTDIKLVVHTAAQPSHDWAAKDPQMDFQVNANGTLNMLEATRKHAPDAVFIFTSTNKVYGDTPNLLPLIEGETRWEIDPTHKFHNGIDESMSIDNCMHSVFGSSKVAADILVQEYGRYFGMKTSCFRGGCLTGPQHSGTKLHGFLAYLMKCCVTQTPYQVFGYKGKQVRDNIHCHDLIQAFDQVFKAPRSGEIYNIGGGRFSNCSMIEAISLCESITGQELIWEYQDTSRMGDHIWWISNTQKFQDHYPNWKMKYNVKDILAESYACNSERWMQQEEPVC